MGIRRHPAHRLNLAAAPVDRLGPGRVAPRSVVVPELDGLGLIGVVPTGKTPQVIGGKETELHLNLRISATIQAREHLSFHISS